MNAQQTSRAATGLAIAMALVMILSACSSDSGESASTTTTVATPDVSGADAADSGSDEPDNGDDAGSTSNTLGSRGEAGEAQPTTTEQTAPPDDPQAPRVVRFEPGASAAVMSDAVVRGNRHTYTVSAGAGQTMELLITSLEDNAVYDLLDPDGTVLEREATNTSTVLPVDGVYRVVVGGTRGNASYELTVVIPPIDRSSEQAAEPDDADDPRIERIQFAPGTSSATVTGQVANQQVKLYTLEVSAGQTMGIVLTSPQNNGLVSVVAPGGGIVITDATFEEFELLEDGDYTLIVSAAEGQALYELTVTVT